MVYAQPRDRKSDGAHPAAKLSGTAATSPSAFEESCVTNKKYPLYGYAGIAGIIGAEALLFGGNSIVGHWFTPIVWSAYILSIDGLIYKLKGQSLLTTDRTELVLIGVISIAAWWLFELYNSPRFWKSDLEL